MNLPPRIYTTREKIITNSTGLLVSSDVNGHFNKIAFLDGQFENIVKVQERITEQESFQVKLFRF